MNEPVPEFLIGVGKEAEVFDAGPNVLKLYRSGRGSLPAFREGAALAAIANLGLPAPAVVAVGRHGDRWGITMTKAPGASLAEQMKTSRDHGPFLAEMVRLHRLLHSKPGRYLLPFTEKLRINISEAPLLRPALRERLFDGLSMLPRGERLCHGDFHPFNIVGAPGHTMIVDWLDACQGDPAADVCRTYLLVGAVDPQLAERYVAAYAANTGMTVEAILAWLPYLAAARLNEGVGPENERLLALAEGV